MHTYIHTYTYIHITTKIIKLQNMKPKGHKQQALLIKYVRGMYKMMQFAQVKQSVYRVQLIKINNLQYSSPVLFLSCRGIRPIGFVNKSNTTIF